MGRANGAPFPHPALMPIAAYPPAWIPSQLTALHPGVNNPHSSTPTSTTDINPPADTPSYFGSSVEIPTYLSALIATGFLISLMTGIAALSHRLLRRSSSPPGQPGYKTLEEEPNPQGGRIGPTLASGANLPSPQNQLNDNKQERLTFNKWTFRQMSN